MKHIQCPEYYSKLFRDTISIELRYNLKNYSPFTFSHPEIERLHLFRESLIKQGWKIIRESSISHATFSKVTFEVERTSEWIEKIGWMYKC